MASASASSRFQLYSTSPLRIKTPRRWSNYEDDTHTPPPTRKSSDLVSDDEFPGVIGIHQNINHDLSSCICITLLCILGYCILFLPKLLFGSLVGQHHLRNSSS
jgi:hypothetical protein